MPVQLEYRNARGRAADSGRRPGLIFATVGLALANFSYLMSYMIWDVDWSGKLRPEVRIVLALSAGSAAVLAGIGLTRAVFHPRPMQAVIFASVAFILAAPFLLLLLL